MKKYISSLLFLIAAALWGFAFSAQKAASTLPAFTIGASRNIIGSLFLLLVIPALDRFTKNGRRLFTNKKLLDFNKYELIGGSICGVILTAASAFQQIGLGDGTDAGKAAFITALYVVIVPIISLFVGKRSPLNVWVSVGIAVVGFYFLCIKADFTLAPSDLLVLICAIIFALHIIAIDRFSPRCDGVRMSCVQFFVAFFLNAVLALIFENPIDFAALGATVLPILYLGICSSGIAYTLQIVGQKDADPAVASIILSLESVFGVIGGALLLSEKMSVREYVGCAIVFVAVILSQLDLEQIGNSIQKKKKKRRQKMSDLKEKQISREEIFSGEVLHLVRDKICLPNGREATREMCLHVGASAVIPLLDDGRVIMEHQYRYAMGREFFEIPAGKLNYPEEDPLLAAKRELREETGAVAKKWTYLGEIDTTPALMNEKIHLYLAEGISFGERELDDDEFLNVELVPLSTLVDMVKSGKIKDAKTQIAVLKAHIFANK